MSNVVWLIPALPLAGFLLILCFGRRLGEPLAGWFATAMSGGAFLAVAIVFVNLIGKTGDQRHITKVVFEWLPVGTLKVSLGFLADPLSVTMALFITGIGTLIHLYSIGYMHGDPKFSKFFLYLNLFVFSMLVLVLGSNMLVTFIGWEGVGTCSYFLISFWHTRESAATAGKKAFVTNRIGDWGFMLAMFFTFQAVGSLDYVRLNEAAATLTHSTAIAIALFLFLGACGKSAQLPLYIWLPDAMEGPTPVSALIHAATMVTAGVYLMCRVSPLLHTVPNVGTVIAVVGAATALFAATVAVAQNDIKKVLAYSTVSQLGYMFLAVGSGAYVAAIFHMVTHAFFKALMFLGSGSVIHGMHDEQDMRRMGRLRKLMPITAATFIVGWLAIAGVPPFAGFWSKDEILLAASQKSWALWAVGFVTALLTAYYMTRQVIMVFFGEAHWDDAKDKHAEALAADAAGHGVEQSDAAAHVDAAGHDEHVHAGAPHESPWLMLAPLVALAGLSIVGGGLNLPFTSGTKKLGHWLDPVLGEAERQVQVSTGLKVGLAVLTAIACIVSIGLAYLVYERRRIEPVEPAILAEGWRYDRAVSWFMGKPGRDGFEAVTWADANIVDGAVNGTATGVRTVGSQLRRLQTGYVRNYALGIALGAVLMLAWFVSRGVF